MALRLSEGLGRTRDKQGAGVLMLALPLCRPAIERATEDTEGAEVLLVFAPEAQKAPLGLLVHEPIALRMLRDTGGCEALAHFSERKTRCLNVGGDLVWLTQVFT